MLTLFAVITGNVTVKAQQLGEYEIKAGFVYNFMKYVDWPSGAFEGKGDAINFCIYGLDSSEGQFDKLQGKTIQEKKLIVKQVNSLRGLKGCHVLFISPSEREYLSQIIDTAKGLNVLTVSDVRGWAQEGVIINFYLEDKKVRFEINLDSASRSKLKISSHLLKLARIIRDGR